MTNLKRLVISVTLFSAGGAGAQELIRRGDPSFRQVSRTLNGSTESETVKTYFETTAKDALKLVEQNDFRSACRLTSEFIRNLPVVSDQRFQTSGAVFVRESASRYANDCLKAIDPSDRPGKRSRIDIASDFYLRLAELFRPLTLRLGSVHTNGGNRDKQYYGFFIDSDRGSIIVGHYDGDADLFSVVNSVKELQVLADGASVLYGTLSVFGVPAREKSVRVISASAYAYRACDKIYSDFNTSNKCKEKAGDLAKTCRFHASKDDYSEEKHNLCIDNEAKKLKL
jgi:hypothetical protein